MVGKGLPGLLESAGAAWVLGAVCSGSGPDVKASSCGGWNDAVDGAVAFEWCGRGSRVAGSIKLPAASGSSRAAKVYVH